MSGGGEDKMGKVVAKLIVGERNATRIVRTTYYTVFLEGETVIRKVLSGVVQLG